MLAVIERNGYGAAFEIGTQHVIDDIDRDGDLWLAQYVFVSPMRVELVTPSTATDAV